jgi:hypothetical protein
MASLLQLLLNLAAHSEDAQAPAAAAVRAVCSAAFKSGWPELHHFAPLLMQVRGFELLLLFLISEVNLVTMQHSSSVDKRSTAAVTAYNTLQGLQRDPHY